MVLICEVPTICPVSTVLNFYAITNTLSPNFRQLLSCWLTSCCVWNNVFVRTHHGRQTESSFLTDNIWSRTDVSLVMSSSISICLSSMFCSSFFASAVHFMVLKFCCSICFGVLEITGDPWRMLKSVEAAPKCTTVCMLSCDTSLRLPVDFGDLLAWASAGFFPEEGRIF